MTKLALWSVLVLLTGSPLGSLALLVAVYYIADRLTVRLLPDPIRGWSRYQRAARLRTTLAANPHDRQASRELADICVQRGQYERAVTLLQSSVEADDDATAIFLAGIAHLGVGRVEEGERLLERAREGAAGFQRDSVDLELGRFALRRGDARGAVAALSAFCRERPGSIEGRYLLARAHHAAGEPDKARRARSAAWDAYLSAPPFQRRRERLWAYRANPLRPLVYTAATMVLLALVGQAVVASGCNDPLPMNLIE